MSTNSKPARADIDPDATPIAPLFVLTFLLSAATAVMWNGLGFVAKHAYEFPESTTFILFAVNGGIYALAAFGCGRMLRAIARVLSPRGTLASALIVQGLVGPLIVIFDGAWTIWVVSIVFSFCSALLWTLIESYMSAGRYGRSMRSTIGWWNLTWMASNAIGLAGMAFFIGSGDARWSIGVLGPICLVGAVLSAWFPRSPAEHESTEGFAQVGENYPSMLRSCRVMLPMSYILIGALGPIMPYRLDELGVDIVWETPLTALWLVTRVLLVAGMSKLHFWHGRWGSLGTSGALMLLGFALITIGPGLSSVLIGLALLGIGQGLTYYSAIYYVLAIGKAKVDAAGTHEGLIGVGYGAGPAAGLLGLALGGGAAVGWIVMGLVVASAWPAIQPWQKSRARRTG